MQQLDESIPNHMRCDYAELLVQIEAECIRLELGDETSDWLTDIEVEHAHGRDTDVFVRLSSKLDNRVQQLLLVQPQDTTDEIEEDVHQAVEDILRMTSQAGRRNERMDNQRNRTGKVGDPKPVNRKRLRRDQDRAA